MGIPATNAADYINVIKRIGYEEQLQLQAQQMQAKLWSVGTPMQLKGERTTFDRYDALGSPTEFSLRFQGRDAGVTTPAQAAGGGGAGVDIEEEMVRRRRQIVARRFDKRLRFDMHFDGLETMREELSNPETAKSITAAFNRKRDELWAASVDGNASEWDPNDPDGTLLTIGFGFVTPPNYNAEDTEQTVATSIGTDGAMNVSKLIAAKARLDSLEVAEEGRVLVSHSIQYNQLFEDIRITSGDYGARTLTNGRLAPILGFDFVYGNQVVGGVTNPSEGFGVGEVGHYAYALVKRAMRCGTYKAPIVRVHEDFRFTHKVVLTHYQTFNCTRAFEEDVVRIACDDTP